MGSDRGRAIKLSPSLHGVVVFCKTLTVALRVAVVWYSSLLPERQRLNAKTK
ncbi:hypothetical protein MUK42_35222 [Musa troglodytarum]|uniref:Uncharacterized protein n=1 Tax=Musa troglodytarum TaxID=320322 RepID=A0A9E7EGB2_9LILI|nr:hypothetical protein MUK42_35222 [Musa troglodytarum]